MGASACLIGATPGATITCAVCTRTISLRGTLMPTWLTGRPLAKAFCGIAVTAFGAAMLTNLSFVTVTLVTALLT